MSEVKMVNQIGDKSSYVINDFVNAGLFSTRGGLLRYIKRNDIKYDCPGKRIVIISRESAVKLYGKLISRESCKKKKTCEKQNDSCVFWLIQFIKRKL